MGDKKSVSIASLSQAFSNFDGHTFFPTAIVTDRTIDFPNNRIFITSRFQFGLKTKTIPEAISPLDSSFPKNYLKL
jgi:hypothetical protein